MRESKETRYVGPSPQKCHVCSNGFMAKGIIYMLGEPGYIQTDICTNRQCLHTHPLGVRCPLDKAAGKRKKAKSGKSARRSRVPA